MVNSAKEINLGKKMKGSLNSKSSEQKPKEKAVLVGNTKMPGRPMNGRALKVN